MVLNEIDCYSDEIVTFDCGSVLQHGPFNDRIYLLKKGEDADDDLAEKLISLAKKQSYTKILAKLPVSEIAPFIHEGYVIESFIPNCYNGRKSAAILSYYLCDARRKEPRYSEYRKVHKLAVSKKSSPKQPLDSSLYAIRKCDEQDVKEMAAIYKIVFESYPFPIHDPDFILETMEDDVHYYCIYRKENNEMIALSSADEDPSYANAEMTDFATLPEWRGHGFAKQLLDIMEQDMADIGVKTFYTIARAISPGMNITFSKSDYLFGGRLKRNTNISGRIESMNIWYKEVE